MCTYLVQWNYRVQAARKIAACAGIHGARIKTDATYNIFINDQGAKNTNKPTDQKVFISCTVYRCTVVQ